MKKILFVSSLIFSSIGLATNHNDDHGSVSMDQGMESAAGEQFEIEEQKYLKFTKDLVKGEKIAVVNVNGMVCDFCARGIQKTFMKNKNVKKIDVDLEVGKVLIAYIRGYKISFDNIKEKITANGQTPVDMKIIEL
ncbi:MAG: hypothetical protein CMP38_04985 [Rickettsiales bacterium]|nr:hypothetical protein [Rickettsiales bacterium]OUW02618.1 MAG: hypothetical protein CBD16_04070 [Betaproteobacteria bacterium TMED156]|tara:strand:- start:1779 stop:2186 length:408 start_codon:yes stop_codon:yes gene_type:complete